MSLKQELVDFGYVVSPNNIHHMEGVRMYPGGAGIPQPIKGDVQVTHDRIRVYTEQFYGEQYTRRSWWDTVTVAVFDTVEGFKQWLEANGKPAEPGICYDWVD